MTEIAPAGIDAGPVDVPQADPPRTRDYVRGVLTVVGLLVLLGVATWLVFAALGWGSCGCTVGPAPTP